MAGAHNSHSSGNPMIQDTNAGFNAPRFSVVPGNPAGAIPSTSPTFCGSGLPVSWGRVVRPRAPSIAVGVGHIASIIGKVLPFDNARHRSRNSGVADSLRQSRAAGVGHKPQPVTSVGRVDGTSWHNDRPAGVADSIHVSMHSVEPMFANRCRNLLSHEDIGPTGTGEPKQVGP